MSLLLINVGNTRCVAARLTGCAHDAAIEPLLDAPTPLRGSTASRLAGEFLGLRLGAEPVATASVIPRMSEAMVEGLPGLQLVDHTWSFPFAAAVRAHETVGADRWCNVAAAVGAGLRDALIVDAGTATTIDVLKDGVFVGGLIAPGMAFAAGALQKKAPRLWSVPFEPCALRPGRDTTEALQAGSYHVGVHGVTGTVRALLEQFPGSRVVLTGGLGRFLQQPGWQHDPAWTLRGLAVLALRRLAG